jgi:hypothetical protein
MDIRIGLDKKWGPIEFNRSIIFLNDGCKRLAFCLAYTLLAVNLLEHMLLCFSLPRSLKVKESHVFAHGIIAISIVKNIHIV